MGWNIQTPSNLAFGGLDTFLNCPARSRHPHQFGQGRVRSGKGDIACQITRIADAAANQQIALPALLGWNAHLHTQPIVEVWGFLPAPALSRSQPSLGRSARIALMCRCSPLIQTVSLPETARTYACLRS